MFSGRWWIGIAMSLAILLAVTISPAVTQQKPQSSQDKARFGSQKQGVQSPGIEAKAKTYKGGCGLGKLNLTPDQMEAIAPILREAKEKIKALKQNARGKDLSQLKAEAKAIKAEVERQIASILTPEQLQKWQELKARKAEMRAKKQNKTAPAAPTS